MSRKLVVEIVGDTAGLERSFARANRSTQGFGKNIDQASRGAASATLGFRGLGRAVAFASGTFLGGAGLAVAAKAAFGELAASQKVTAQVAAVLRSTGGAANVTAGQVDKLAQALLNKSGVDDEAIKRGEAMILTFRNIRNEVGAGNDIFDRATRAVLDMDTAMSHGSSTQESLSKTSILVGKALNDPIKGLSALSRVGVTFTEGQKRQIASFEKLGDTMGAQKVILGELTKEFGGSAKALGDTLPGKINILRENITNLGGDIAGILTPDIEKVIGKATKWIENSENQARVLGDVREAVGDVSAVLKTTAAAFDKFSDAVGGSRHALELLAGAFAALKFSKILGGLRNIGFAAGEKGAAGQVGLLSSRLSGLNGITVGAILIPVEIEIEAKISNAIKGVAGGKAASVYDTVIGTIAEGLGIPGFGRGKGVTDRILHGIQGGSKDAAAKLTGPAKLTVADVAQAISKGLLTAPGVKGLEDRFVTREQFQAALALAQQDALKFAKAGPASPAPPPFALPPPSPFHKTGRANLSQLALANLALSNAALTTDTTVDDLKALNRQHELLAKAINVETGRLNNAPTVKAAQKFAAALEGLNAKDAAALSQIASIETDNADATQAARSEAAAAATRRKDAATATVRAIAEQHASANEAFADAAAKALTKIATSQNTVNRRAFANVKGVAAAIARGKANLAGELAAQVAAIDKKQKPLNDLAAKNTLGRDSAIAQAVANLPGELADQQQTLAAKVAEAFNLEEGRLSLGRQAADFAATKAGENSRLLARANTLQQKSDLAFIRFYKGRIAATKGLVQQGFQTQLLSAQADLFGLRQTAGAAKTAKLQKSQLAALGLTADGTLVLPHEAIGAELKRLKGSLAGTDLDTKSNRTAFAKISQDIKTGWKGVTDVAKKAIEAYLDGVSDALKGADHIGDQTKFRHVSARSILAGQGLTPEQIRALTPRIAQIGAGGTVPQRTQQFALAGGGPSARGGTTIHIENFNSSAPNIRALEEEFDKRARSRPAVRRGSR